MEPKDYLLASKPALTHSQSLGSIYFLDEFQWAKSSGRPVCTLCSDLYLRWVDYEQAKDQGLCTVLLLKAFHFRPQLHALTLTWISFSRCRKKLDLSCSKQETQGQILRRKSRADGGSTLISQEGR